MTTRRYADARTREQLNELPRYGHIIPISKGLSDRYVEEHYRGWTWNALVQVLSAAGVFVGRGGSPPCCDDLVIRVRFDNDGAGGVE